MDAPRARCPLLSLPPAFQFDEVDGKYSGILKQDPRPPATLGPIEAFQGEYAGTGFNSIFRPNNTTKANTRFKNEVISIQGLDGHDSDNVLELNVTKDIIAFTQHSNMRAVPNRGEGDQGDIFLAGTAYFQVVRDALNENTGRADVKNPQVIHIEPGLWMQVPPSNNPDEPATLLRMGSIPHGTTIHASGPNAPDSIPGAPNFDEFKSKNPTTLVPSAELGGSIQAFEKFSLDVTNENTPRIPQDLTKFVGKGTITQAMLDNILIVLENANTGKIIPNHFTVSVSATNTGVGAVSIVDIPFLDGKDAFQNAAVRKFDATFWINTVQYKIDVPVSKAGNHIEIKPSEPSPGALVPTFLVIPPRDIAQATTITVTSNEIQYFQNINLFFNNVNWPHISVGNLVPNAPVSVPESAFPSTAI